MMESTAGQGDHVVYLVTLWAVFVDFIYLDKVRIMWYTKTGTIRVSVRVFLSTIDWVVFLFRVSFTGHCVFTGNAFPITKFSSVSRLVLTESSVRSSTSPAFFLRVLGNLIGLLPRTNLCSTRSDTKGSIYRPLFPSFFVESFTTIHASI